MTESPVSGSGRRLWNPWACGSFPNATTTETSPVFQRKHSPDLAQKIKTLPSISVRGCFVQGSIEGLHGSALGKYFLECCELAKRMTVILPCVMPYLCIVNGAEAACRNAAEHPQALEAFLRQAEIVAAQNRTAFYAKLLIT